jgi:hypothetical protein
MTVGACDGAGRFFRVAVGDDDRRVDAQDDERAEVGAGDGRRRDRPVPGGDHLPDVCADLGAGRRDLGEPAGGLLERAPGGRGGGDRAEQFVLVGEGADVAEPGAAVGDGDGLVGQDAATVEGRAAGGARERPGPCHGQADRVREHPQSGGAGTTGDPGPTDGGVQAVGPLLRCHLGSAPDRGDVLGFDTLIVPGQGHFSVSGVLIKPMIAA